MPSQSTNNNYTDAVVVSIRRGLSGGVNVRIPQKTVCRPMVNSLPRSDSVLRLVPRVSRSVLCFSPKVKNNEVGHCFAPKNILRKCVWRRSGAATSGHHVTRQETVETGLNLHSYITRHKLLNSWQQQPERY